MFRLRLSELTPTIDDVAHVSWNDRQGCIQSHGIKFTENLPYFLVLLFILGRFDMEQWGENLDLKNTCSRPTPIPGLEYPPGEPLEVKIEESIYHRFALRGRSTQVYVVTAQPQVPDEAELAMKLSWPEESKTPEHEIIGRAYERANKLEHAEFASEIIPHLPRLFGSTDVTNSSTKRIRECLGFAGNELKGSRILRIVVSRRLRPITELIGKECICCFRHTRRCKLS